MYSIKRTTFDDAVNFDFCEAGPAGGFDAVEHARHGVIDVIHRAKNILVERIETDGDAAQACVFERPRLTGEQRAVCGKRKITQAFDAREHADQRFKAASNERLAAGESNLFNAMVDEDASEAFDFFECKKRGGGQELKIAAEDFLRHAVGAAEVAAVGDGNSQVAERPVEGVGHGTGRGAHDVCSLYCRD
jgi:hypothetical protein